MSELAHEQGLEQELWQEDGGDKDVGRNPRILAYRPVHGIRR